MLRTQVRTQVLTIVGVDIEVMKLGLLSSGLELVRRVLGRFGIVLIQTTPIDGERGLLSLQTTLAHASGQWIASAWPVCSLTELSTPHRMGPAMTYARRYALFAIVGIAGDNDLDAPDLNIKPIVELNVSPPGPASGGLANGAPLGADVLPVSAKLV